MAIDVIQLPPDSTGKKVAARSFTENSQTVYAQAGYLTTDTAGGNPAVITNAIPGSTDYGLVTRAFTTGAPFTVQTPANLTASAQSSTATGLDRAGNVMLTIKGTYGFTTTPPTYIFEGSDDAGTTWFPIVAVREDIAVREQTGTLAANTSRSWTIDTTGWTQVRFRLTAWGTPTGAIVARWSPGATAYEPNVTEVPIVRTNVQFTMSEVAPTATDTLTNTVATRDFVAAAGAASQAVTAGKRLRLTGWSIVVRGTSTTAVGTTARLRVNPTGAAVVGSPLVAVIAAGLIGTQVAEQAASAHAVFSDGIELSGTNQLGVSLEGIATANATSLSIFGYEY